MGVKNYLDMVVSKHGELYKVKDTDKCIQVQPETRERGVSNTVQMKDSSVLTDMSMVQIA